MSRKLIYRGAIQALAAVVLLCAPLFAQITAVTTPGFKNGTLTVGRDADSLYKLPSVATAETGYVMLSNGLNGEMTWGTSSASGDTVILGSDTIFVAQIAKDTANARWKLLGDTVQTDSTVRMDGDMTYIRNVRLGESGGVGGNVTSSTAISIDVLIPTENSFATTKFYVDSLLAKAILDSAATVRGEIRDTATAVWNDSVGAVETRAREDAGDTAAVYLDLAKADMRDSSTVVWNDSIPAYTSRDSTRNKVLRPNTLPDSSVSGEVFYAIAGAALTFGDLVYWRNDTLFLANGDTTGATYLLPAAAMSADKTTSSGAVGMFLRTGYARAEGWIHLPIGGVVYVDTVATGQMSRYAPTVAGMGSQPVGVTVDSTSGVVDFRPTYVITVK
ncbi:MAG: hypothetical protein C4542_08205 [Dehalococcoidia bacterium]|nr:MAG: hypothetical protein C4542_08205 [Dehalococcoidia bacterium]